MDLTLPASFPCCNQLELRHSFPGYNPSVTFECNPSCCSSKSRPLTLPLFLPLIPWSCYKPHGLVLPVPIPASMPAHLGYWRSLLCGTSLPLTWLCSSWSEMHNSPSSFLGIWWDITLLGTGAGSTRLGVAPGVGQCEARTSLISTPGRGILSFASWELRKTEISWCIHQALGYEISWYWGRLWDQRYTHPIMLSLHCVPQDNTPS